MTTLLLLLLLLPAPASSQAAAGLRALAKTPLLKKLVKTVAKEAATAGGSALLKQAMGKSNGGGNSNRLGAAAADNAGSIVYSSTSVGGGQIISGVVTIFKDFTWVRCPEAISSVPCSSPTCTTVLDITADDCDSSIAGGGNCNYEYGSADDGSNTLGYLASEEFTVAGTGTTTTPVALVFGCSTDLPPDGELNAVGFSRGQLSVPSQLGVSRFSYYVSPDDSSTSEATSVVLLGEQAVPQTKHSRSTPLLDTTNLVFPDLYYVQLTGIQVDGEPLSSIPPGAFDLAEDGSSGGVVLSTTTAITYLQAHAYDAVRQALVSAIKSDPVSNQGGFDLCYNINSVAELTFPKITLVFGGKDSPAMELTTVHYFYKYTQPEGEGLQCLTMLPMPAGESVGTILGSMMQAGTNMIYDVGGGQLIFEKAAAASLLVNSSHVFQLIATLLLAWVLLF